MYGDDFDLLLKYGSKWRFALYYLMKIIWIEMENSIR